MLFVSYIDDNKPRTYTKIKDSVNHDRLVVDGLYEIPCYVHRSSFRREALLIKHISVYICYDVRVEMLQQLHDTHNHHQVHAVWFGTNTQTYGA